MEKAKNKPFMALEGKIVEEGHTYKSLAAAIGRSPKFISNRVSGKVDFSMDVQSVLNFNTLDTLSRLGAATSDIAEMLLREIEATVKDIQKTERKQSRTFAKSRIT